MRRRPRARAPAGNCARERGALGLLLAIQALSVNAAEKLPAAFGAHEAAAKGLVVPAPVAPVAPAKPTGSVALSLAVLAMADELDLAPHRLRAALSRLLARAAEAGFSLDSARSELTALLAEPQSVETR